MPFFSVIVTTYNRPEYIQRAVNSVLSQSYKDFELIIINDGSTQDYSLFESFLENYKGETLIRYYFIQNIGRSAARNYAIDKATGTYICFLDDDDLFYENHLDVLYNEIINRKYCEALFHTRSVRNSNGFRVKEKPSSFDEKCNISKVVKDIFTIDSVAIHANILKNKKFNDKLIVAEDTDLWIRIALEYPIINIEKFTIEYFVHESNTYDLSNKASMIERLRTLFYFKTNYKEHLGNIYLTEVITKQLLLLVELEYRDSSYSNSLKRLIQALVFNTSVLSKKYFYVMLFKNLLKKII